MTAFITGGAAKAEQFYGRERETAIVLQQPRAWICGQRRIGKTSLLHNVKAAALDMGWIPILTDLTTLTESESTADSFLEYIADEVEDALGSELPEFDNDVPARALSNWLAKLLGQFPDKRVFLLIDEAERLVDIDDDTPGFLDKLNAWTYGMDRLQFAMASSQALSCLFNRSGREFIESFFNLALRGLEEPAAKALLNCEQGDGWPTPLPDEVVENAVRWSGGHARILQEVGFRLSVHASHEDHPIDNLVLRSCFDEIANDQSLRSIFENDFAKLTPAQQCVLTAACLEPDSDIEVETLRANGEYDEHEVDDAVLFLNNYGYIGRDNGQAHLKYQFYPRFLPKDIASLSDPKDIQRIDWENSPPADEQSAGEVSRAPIKIIYSYAPEDERLLRRLTEHLAILERQGVIDGWHKRMIEAGIDQDAEVDKHWNEAAVILLLISASFVASDYCYGREVMWALEREQRNEARVIPIILRPVDWEAAPFGRLKPLPENSKAVTVWTNRDAAFFDVARGIRKAVEGLFDADRGGE